MSENERLEFFRRALGLCVRWNRSPQVARVIGGKPRTLREVMISLGEGSKPPAVRAREARTLAGEFTAFGYSEILAGLSGRRNVRGRSARARRPQRAGRARAQVSA